MDMPGLVNMGCEHERQEYIETRWGADWRRCLDCMEIIELPMDALGG